MFLPEAFSRNITQIYGEQGRAWMENLPVLLADCCQRWSLTLGEPFDLSFNYVAPAMCSDGTACVLKAGVPSGEPANEIEAMRFYDGHGMALLLDCDPDQGILLLERLSPGTTLLELFRAGEDARATSLAAQVMKQLWRPIAPGHSFPAVRDWANGMTKMRAHFGGGTGPFPTALVEEAETLFRELLDSMTENVLLHGDLHHANILAAEREPWLAIDPKGVVGEPAFEVGAWLRNWLPDLLEMPEPVQIQARRIDLFAEELGIDRARIRGWGIAQAVLSAWWTIEDNGDDWEPTIACAKLLAAVKV